MNKIDYEQSYLVSHLLNCFPPLLRGEVISDSEFSYENGISTDAGVCFGGSNASFSRTKLFESIRDAFFLSDCNASLQDNSGGDWSVSITPDEKPTIDIKNQEENLKINTFWPLMNDIEQRVLILKKEAKKGNLSSEDIEFWVGKASKKHLTDDEVGDLIDELEHTPRYIEELLSIELVNGSNKVKTLVPSNIKYYERLVGKIEGSSNISEYCDVELQEHLTNRENSEISYLDLLMCSQQFISKTISAHMIDEELFISLAEVAIKSENPLMLTGCLEIGILNYSKGVNPTLFSLFECLISPEMIEKYTLLCAMTVFVDGELARLNIFKDMPPYYRRLAALTQASLITKVAVEQKANFEDIEKWTMNERGLIFYCQSFIDLRVEPKWLPSYLTPEQIRDELYGRINLACQKHSEINFSQYALDHFSENSSIKLNAFFPGPLEGNIPPGDVPEDIMLNLEESLSKNASFEAFTSLINLAQICKIDEKYVELAVSLLNNANHQLKATEDKKSIYQTLNGLAKVAGTVRSKKLAASVMILSRVYRDYLNVNAEPENIMAVGLVASAAFEDKDEWANYIGQWFSELSYLPLEQNAAVSLRSMLDQLCVLEPYLYYTCSRPLEILKCLIIE